MGVVVQSFDGRMPGDLYERLVRLRRRHRAVLQAAAAGDFSNEAELHALSRRLGRMLAETARMPVEQRGGLRMLEISLAVDRMFPELRAWNQQAAFRYPPAGRAAGR
ncbi:hypothetical protein [Symbiobacterium thermophilum]|uniref:Uncharacterized protein n=1 Tax=Symbiobacterium thermophilum TaxID=2734 RepID=A0A953IC81_SYMTR|nr:hypothetical protein [Symbiobacterium thermophilum]MBY6275515.1 hypothetical protein [Symbiobacterium thermophilum]